MTNRESLYVATNVLFMFYALVCADSLFQNLFLENQWMAFAQIMHYKIRPSKRPLNLGFYVSGVEIVCFRLAYKCSDIHVMLFKLTAQIISWFIFFCVKQSSSKIFIEESAILFLGLEARTLCCIYNFLFHLVLTQAWASRGVFFWKV